MKKTRLLTLSISLLIAGGLITSVVAERYTKPLPIKIITPTSKSIDPPMP